jgi:L-alanine-DL-glutamate epimerase-like enolase superfamily enzyme
MKIVKMETFIASIPYRHMEISSRVNRNGVTDVAVKLTADNGLIGWGESCSGADVKSVEHAVHSAKPYVIGRNPWDMDRIAFEYFKTGLWDFRIMTGQFAFAGIDQALWDLCGKEAGQPVYKLLGGAMRDSVNYFYYLSHSTLEEMAGQCRDGVDKGYSVFYLKVGIDSRKEEELLYVIRETIGPERKIRIDANEAWSVPEAVKLLQRWNTLFDIDFCEAPVKAIPVENMQDVKNKVSVAICANEGLGRPSDCLQMIRSRAADILCFSSYWVGTLRKFQMLSQLAALEGLRVVKHTHGEFGIAAAAMHHVMLNVPNAMDGVQQTAHVMADDILQTPVPLNDGPDWGRLEGSGLGIEVDEDKLMHYHEHYLKEGQYLPNQVE